MSLTTVDNAKLKNFTPTGAQHFNTTVEDYSQVLLARSLSNAKVDQVAGMQLEVTHQHVRNAAHHLANSYGRPQKPQWLVYTQIAEYLCTGAAGYGLNLMTSSDTNTQHKGILWFTLNAAVVVLLIVIRLIQGKSE